MNIDGNDISRTISLDRIVGRLKINIKNLDNHTSTAVINDNAMQFYPGSQTVNGYTETWYGSGNTPASPAGLLTMNVYAPFSITIYGDYGTDGEVSTTIDSVRVYPNKTTVLSGNLPFPDQPQTSSNSQSFSVRVNDTWDSDTTKISF